MLTCLLQLGAHLTGGGQASKREHWALSWNLLGLTGCQKKKSSLGAGDLGSGSQIPNVSLETARSQRNPHLRPAAGVLVC